MMDMLTNYDYTFDYTSDGDGAAETWGAEAGYGIISASKMLAWVEANCDACSGEERAQYTPSSLDFKAQNCSVLGKYKKHLQTSVCVANCQAVHDGVTESTTDLALETPSLPRQKPRDHWKHDCRKYLQIYTMQHKVASSKRLYAAPSRFVVFS